MFILKKLISQVFYPVPLCLEILIIGMVLLLFTRKQRAGKLIISIGVMMVAVFGYEGIPNTILRSLEYQYPPLIVTAQSNTVVNDVIPSVKWIVVLGGGHTSDPKIPVTSQISEVSLVRLIEGIRLHNKTPGSKLILSEGKVFDLTSGAEVMAEIARAIGVDQKDIILEDESKDTAEEARLIKSIVGSDEFILVTSAAHMPRAVAMFKKLGMHPIPAPTGYLVIEGQNIDPSNFFPSSGGFFKTSSAFHEYIGLVWAKLRGQI